MVEPRRPEDLQQPGHDHAGGCPQTHVLCRGRDQVLSWWNFGYHHRPYCQSWGRSFLQETLPSTTLSSHHGMRGAGHYFFLTFSPLPGPSAGPGGQGWHSEGHYLSVWPAAGHGLNTCRHWRPFVIASRERGAPSLHNYLGRLESWPCTQPGRPWSLLSTPDTFIPTQNPSNLLPYCVVSSPQTPP